jgi:hypothetical protein
VGTSDIRAAWAGGHRGRVVIDRVLPLVPTLLSAGTIITERERERCEGERLTPSYRGSRLL